VVDGIEITGSSGFSVRIDQCSPDPFIGGDGCLLRVRAKPTVLGAAAGTLRIPTDAGTTLTVPLTMTGQAQALSLSPTSLSFSIPRSSSLDREVVVTNISASAVTMRGTAVTHGGSGFGSFTVVSNTCRDLVLAPGATCAVGVTFSSATVAGEGTGELTISSTRDWYAVRLVGRTTATGTPGRPGVPELRTMSVRVVGVPARVSASWTARVAWTRRMPVGLDASGTVYSVAFRRETGAWKTVYRGKQTSVDVKLPPGPISVRVTARNGDLVSPSVDMWVNRRLSDVRTAPRRWTLVSDAGSIGGRFVRATTSGARVALDLQKPVDGFAVVVRRGSRKGVFDVWIDGRKEARVTVPAGSLRRRMIIWQLYAPQRSIEKIEIRTVSGRVDLDGFMLVR
jgi:hypothetical protein